MTDCDRRAQLVHWLVEFPLVLREGFGVGIRTALALIEGLWA